jgi:hypothetical protein
VLLPMGLFSVAAGACFGPAIMIISMGQAQKTFRLSAIGAPLVLTLMPLGAVLGGAPGAAWGQLIAQGVQIPFWFWTLHRILHPQAVPAAAPRRHVTYRRRKSAI